MSSQQSPAGGRRTVRCGPEQHRQSDAGRVTRRSILRLGAAASLLGVAGIASAQSGGFEIVDVSPEEATLDRYEFIEIEVTVENSGESRDTQTIELHVEANPQVTVADKELTLDPGERGTVVLNAQAIFPPGEYTPVVSTENDEFRGSAVINAPDGEGNETDGNGNTTDGNGNMTDGNGNTTDGGENTTDDSDATDGDGNATDDGSNATDDGDSGDGSGPGFGLLTALAGASGLGYLYRRRLTSD